MLSPQRTSDQHATARSQSTLCGGVASGSSARVIIVDADRRAASATAGWLCGLGWHASAAGSIADVRKLLGRGKCDACVVVAPGAAGGAGEWLLLRNTQQSTGWVAVLPAVESPEGDAGWDARVSMPAADEALLAALAVAIDAGRQRIDPPATSLAASPSPTSVLGNAPAIRRVLEVAARVADTGATVLITGESGTGKSLLAREIHRLSGRRDARFVEVACGSLAESLLESELFGHVAGAFTGATTDREGRFSQADGGTMFLDEIATATPAMQVKLLRVLQDLEFEPVGGGKTRHVDARLILATHEDLDGLVAAGRFRSDLFWRINVVAIEMPALRQRRCDIPLLAHHFLAVAAARAGRAVEGFTPAALDALCSHDWPGNVRELQHAVERGVFLGIDTDIDLADLPPAVTAAAPPATAGGCETSLRHSLVAPERQLIVAALEKSGWRRDAAARALGINRTTLYKKAKRLGLDLSLLPVAGG